jgi:cyclic pyranopterin phosphate synthase
MWYLCLYARAGLDLKGLVRSGASAAEIEHAIAGVWRKRDDRGAERRLALRERGPLVDAGTLRQDPHLEMHTRGG